MNCVCVCVCDERFLFTFLKKSLESNCAPWKIHSLYNTLESSCYWWGRGDEDYDDEDDISTACEPKPSCVNNQKPTIGHKIWQ